MLFHRNDPSLFFTRPLNSSIPLLATSGKSVQRVCPNCSSSERANLSYLTDSLYNEKSVIIIYKQLSSKIHVLGSSMIT